MRINHLTLAVTTSETLSKDQLDNINVLIDLGYITISHISGRQGLMDTTSHFLNQDEMEVIATVSSELEESTLTKDDLADIENLNFIVYAAFDDSVPEHIQFGNAEIEVVGGKKYSVTLD